MARPPVSEIAAYLSRRSFFKLGGLGLLSFLLTGREWSGARGADLGGFSDLNPGQQGRVTEGQIEVYDSPSYSGKRITSIWRDTVVDITNVTIGDAFPPHNRVWYFVGDGYVHSGAIKPVKTILNDPQAEIPVGGRLAEVSVPFTDAYWGAGKDQLFAYRFYYETTHWVTHLYHDQRGDAWYEVLDDKFKFHYYVPATHLRPITPDEVSGLSSDVPPAAKRLEVRTNEQVAIAYEHDIPVYMARTATGAQFRDGNYSTPAGHYLTFHKRPYRHMAAGDMASNGYDLPGVPWICYITEGGMAFHGTYWHNDFGKPRSHGCINLNPSAAKWVYRWTQPSVPVDLEYVYEDYGTGVDVV